MTSCLVGREGSGADTALTAGRASWGLPAPLASGALYGCSSCDFSSSDLPPLPARIELIGWQIDREAPRQTTGRLGVQAASGSVEASTCLEESRDGPVRERRRREIWNDSG